MAKYWELDEEMIFKHFNEQPSGIKKIENARSDEGNKDKDISQNSS